MIARLLLFAVLGTVFGCASRSTSIAEAVRPGRNIGPAIVCQNPCILEWERAQEWIETYSFAPVERADDSVIETQRPQRDRLSGPTFRSFVAAKQHLAGTMSWLRLGQICEVVGPPAHVCEPPTNREVEIAFYYYVREGVDLFRGLGVRLWHPQPAYLAEPPSN